MNMNSTRPTLASPSNAVVIPDGNTTSRTAVPKRVGPTRMPATISPTTAGWPTRRASIPKSRVSAMMVASASIIAPT
jgi:hypothetical protein